MPAPTLCLGRTLRLLGLTGAALGCTGLQAQDAVTASPHEKTCRTEVSKFEETIGFLRQTQGPEAAARVKEELLPAKLENEILMQHGYCGLVKHLRDKHLL